MYLFAYMCDYLVHELMFQYLDYYPFFPPYQGKGRKKVTLPVDDNEDEWVTGDEDSDADCKIGKSSSENMTVTHGTQYNWVSWD